MIRFGLKSALALGVLAALVPLGTGERADGSRIDPFALAVGVQQAVTDLGGFCGRAPQACTAAREVALYAGERIEDGVRFGYAYLTTEAAEPPDADARPATAPPQLATDPVLTGAVEDFPLPRPYLPPRSAEPLEAASVEVSSVLRSIAVPTPAPRR